MSARDDFLPDVRRTINAPQLAFYRQAFGSVYAIAVQARNLEQAELRHGRAAIGPACGRIRAHVGLALESLMRELAEAAPSPIDEVRTGCIQLQAEVETALGLR